MKKMKLLFLTAFLLSGLTGCKNKRKYDYDGKGVLVSSTLYQYTRDGKTNESRTDTIYDENGKELFVYYYRNSDTKPYACITNKYNEKGQITKSDYDYSYNGVVITTEYEYDNELLTKETSNGINGKTKTYTYDENKNLITVLEDSGNGFNRDIKIEYEYYDNNNLKCKIYYMSEDYEKDGWKATEKYEYTYDEIRSAVNELYYSYNEESDSFDLSFKNEYFYDDNSTLLESFRYVYSTTDGTWKYILKTENIYEKNKKIKYVCWIWKENESWEESTKIDYKYDKKNNLILETHYSNKSGSMRITEKEEIKYTYYK